MANSTQGSLFDLFGGEEQQPQPKPVRKKTLRPPAQVTIEAPVSEAPTLTIVPVAEQPIPEKEEIQATIDTAVVAVTPPGTAVYAEDTEEVVEPEITLVEDTLVQDEIIEDIIIEEADATNEPIAILDMEPPVLDTGAIIPQHKRPAGVRGRKSVKENSQDADLVVIPPDEELFKKQYYSMGEVTALFKENHSLIRYWEKEFSILKPKKNGKGDRFFRPVDVKNLALIYDLLRRRKFTIEGAKDYLKNIKKADEKFAAVQSLQKIKDFFLELRANI